MLSKPLGRIPKNTKEQQEKQKLAFLVRHKQKSTADHYCPHAGPEGDVDSTLFLNRQLERTQLRFVGLARLAQPGAPQHESNSEALYASTLNETNDYHHKRDDQENVYDSAKCVRCNPPEQPENQ